MLQLKTNTNTKCLVVVIIVVVFVSIPRILYRIFRNSGSFRRIGFLFWFRSVFSLVFYAIRLYSVLLLDVGSFHYLLRLVCSVFSRDARRYLLQCQRCVALNAECCAFCRLPSVLLFYFGCVLGRFHRKTHRAAKRMFFALFRRRRENRICFAKWNHHPWKNIRFEIRNRFDSFVNFRNSSHEWQ